MLRQTQQHHQPNHFVYRIGLDRTKIFIRSISGSTFLVKKQLKIQISSFSPTIRKMNVQLGYVITYHNFLQGIVRTLHFHHLHNHFGHMLGTVGVFPNTQRDFEHTWSSRPNFPKLNFNIIVCFSIIPQIYHICLKPKKLSKYEAILIPRLPTVHIWSGSPFSKK